MKVWLLSIVVLTIGALMAPAYGQRSSSRRRCYAHGCHKCAQATSECSECRYGFFLSKGHCESCQIHTAGCHKCNATHCLTCGQGNKMTSKGKCMQCPSGCVDCELAADGKVQCLACERRHYLSNDSRCVSCSTVHENCESCDAEGCIHCSRLTDMLTDKRECLRCDIVGCLECRQYTGSFTCDRCDQDYFLTADMKCQVCSVYGKHCQTCNSISCVACPAPSTLNILGYCVDCGIANCARCDTSTGTNPRCVECNDGYFLKGGECIRCAEAFGAECRTCQEDGCVTCLGNSMPSSTGQCESCRVANCHKCQENRTDTCAYCNAGFYADGKGGCGNCKKYDEQCTFCDGSSCSHCAAGYTMNKLGRCEMKKPRCTVSGCEKCSADGKSCERCQPPFVITSKQQCEPCMLKFQGCGICNPNGCLVCLPGRKMNANRQCII